MNREIKFRAWDAEKKYFMQPAQVELYTLKGFRATRKRFTLNQYTGLKDKNGVEIYEGDILAMYRHNDNTHRHEPGQVWIDGKYKPDIREVRWESGTFFTMGEYNLKSAFMHLARPGESFEVIGNIYEHPHLLNS